MHEAIMHVLVNAGEHKILENTPSILVLEDIFDCDTVFKTQL
jgi:hypothetical protein